MKSFQEFLLTEGENPPESRLKHEFRWHARTFKPLHYETMRDYKLSSEKYNDRLRNEWPFIDKDTHEQVSHLDHITSHHLEKDYIGYRSIIGHEGEKIRNLAPGETFSDRGYTSTSLNRNKVKKHFMHPEQGDNHYLRIHIPQGAKAYYLDIHKGLPNSHENELLLRRGTSFQVLGHETKKEYNPKDGGYKKVNNAYRRNTSIYHITHLKVIHQEEPETPKLKDPHNYNHLEDQEKREIDDLLDKLHK